MNLALFGLVRRILGLLGGVSLDAFNPLTSNSLLS